MPLFFRSLGKSSPTRYTVNKYRVHEGNILIKDIRYLEMKSEKYFMLLLLTYLCSWYLIYCSGLEPNPVGGKLQNFWKNIKMHFCIQLNQKYSPFFISCRYFHSDSFFFFKIGNILNISVKSAWAHVQEHSDKRWRCSFSPLEILFKNCSRIR